MVERYPFDPIARRAQELEILHNGLALDPDTIIPWTKTELFKPDTNKRDTVRYARTAISGVLPRLTTSREDIDTISNLLTHDQLLRRLS